MQLRVADAASQPGVVVDREQLELRVQLILIMSDDPTADFLAREKAILGKETGRGVLTVR